MSFSTKSTTVLARKEHRCTNCAEAILPGETYQRWVTFDDSAFTNKMHPECLEALDLEAEGARYEYLPYCGERPAKEPA